MRVPRAAWLAVGALAAALVFGGRDAPFAPVAGWAAGLAALVAIVFAFAGYRSRRLAPTALLVAFGSVALRVALGALLTGASLDAGPLPAGSGRWQGQVVDVSSPSGAEQRAFVRLRAGAASDETWLVYAWLPRHPALLPGDRIEVSGELQPPPADVPGFAGFLEARGAAGTLKVRALTLTGSGSGLGPTVEHVRWGLDEHLARAVPEPEAGLAAGILVGLRERVARKVADDFTVTGLTHVVAISGWNIALVAGIVTAMLRATGLRRRARSALVLLAIVAYTILAGAEASVVRAAVMGVVVLVARESGRPSGAAAALGLACWGLLLAAPAMIDDIGLQLSLAATAGLLALGGPAVAAVRRLTRGRGPRWLEESLGVSVAAQLSTLPLILLHFGRLSLISPLANVLVAPVVPLAMLGALVGVLLGGLLSVLPLPLLLAPLLVVAWLPLAAMTRGADLLARVPLASVELVPPLDLAGAAAGLALLAAVLRHVHGHEAEPTSASSTIRAAPASSAASVAPAASVEQAEVTAGRRRARTGLVGLLAVSLTLATSVVLVAGPGPLLRVSVLDIGQGDAILLETAGARMLVDGGPDPDLLVRRLDERIPAWDRRIDLVVLTHPHEDHAGGLAGLSQRYAVGRIVETGMNSEGAGVTELRAAAERQAIPRVRVLRGDQLPFGEVRVDVLWPPRHALPDHVLEDGRAINGTSIVLAVSAGRQRLLLTGDIEDDHDHDILEAIGSGSRPWDLLKVAHHGSATASGRPLLEALQPRVAAISVGADNRYGHPARGTLERLEDVGAATWRTDRQGTLSLAFDGGARAPTSEGASRDRIACAHGHRPAPSRAAATDPCYIRPDGGTHTLRSALAADVHLALTGPAAAHDGGGRGGRLPGASRLARRRLRGPSPGGNGRAPP